VRKHTAARWLSRHPYTVTSLVFFGAILCGWFLLGWGERQLAFVLLLYFIVALGVRLDEIFRAIGGPSGNPSPTPKPSSRSCAKSATSSAASKKNSRDVHSDIT